MPLRDKECITSIKSGNCFIFDTVLVDVVASGCGVMVPGFLIPSWDLSTEACHTD